MSRHRSISTDISTDTQVAELAEHGPLPLLLYTWAIPHADDWGRMTGDPRQFKLLVCPGLEVTAKDVEQAVTLIAEVGLWLRYEVAGKWYIAFTPSSWFKHQNYIPKSKRQADRSAYPAPQNPAYRLDDGRTDGAENDTPHIPADPRTSPLMGANHRESPQNPASPSPSPSPSPIPPVDTSGGEIPKERMAPAARLTPTHGALALTSPSPSSAISPAISPAAKVVAMPAARPVAALQRTRAPDDLWDACVTACGGTAPSNKVERGKWNKGLAALRESGATAEDLAPRATRYRRRYGERIALNPMALASNWTQLSEEVHDHAQQSAHDMRSGSGNQSASRSGGRSGGRSSSYTGPHLLDADEWDRWEEAERAKGHIINGH